jgi:hypothetical protein
MKLLTASALALILSVPALAAPTTIDAANEVAINGESFFGGSNIRDELTRLARRDSVIAPTATFRQIAVSGALIAQILGYYRNAVPKPKYVISDGGGNDLMGACPSPAAPSCPVVQTTFATVRAYFDTMAFHGTKKVLWMRYPDPQGSNWATLKTNQDLFNPLVKQLCDTIQVPKCLWIDLRPVWEGHYTEYTTDGIHATNAGGTATAEAFWKIMVDSSFFETTPTSIARSGAESFGARIVSGAPGVQVRISEPGFHHVSVSNAQGREFARRQGSGPMTYRFDGLQPGLYVVRARVNDRVLVRKVFSGL